jgi:hypothetical protein
MRVRRATAPGSNEPSANKAGEFMQELGSACYDAFFLVVRRAGPLTTRRPR